MNAERYAFDTNVLFYSLDPAVAEKHTIARRLIANADINRAVVPLQTLGELCSSVRRKRPGLTEAADRWVQRSLILFDVVPATPADLSEAIAAGQLHNLSFWDAMLWATARRAGCTLLLSEDFQDGRSLGGVTCRNPFLLSANELTSLLG